MIKFDEKLIVQILEQLSKYYPHRIVNYSKILPEYKNRKETKKYLAYCEGGELITYKEIWKHTQLSGITHIRITTKGIKYLIEKSR